MRQGRNWKSDFFHTQRKLSVSKYLGITFQAKCFLSLTDMKIAFEADWWSAQLRIAEP